MSERFDLLLLRRPARHEPHYRVRLQKLNTTCSFSLPAVLSSKMTNCWFVGDSQAKVQPFSLRTRFNSSAISMAWRLISKYRLSVNSVSNWMPRSLPFARSAPCCLTAVLAAQGADLGAADIKHVAELCYILERHIRAAAHKPIAETRAVQEERDLILSADP